MRHFLQEVKEQIIQDRRPITGWLKREAIYEEAGQFTYRDQNWVPFQTGELWSEEEDVTTFFKTSMTVPAEWSDQKVILKVLTGGEAAVYLNGEIYHGLDENHHHAPLDAQKYAGQEVDLLIEAALNRINKLYVPVPNYRHCFALAELQVIDPEMKEFYYNLLALVELSEVLTAKEHADGRLIEEIIDQLREGFASPERDIRGLNALYHTKVADLKKVESYQMACFGHAHIDVAWLWQFKETIRKCGRTFSTALRLMELYPEFRFIQSQPKLYQYVKSYYPALYREIKAKVQTGEWQVEGSMWVEADTNLVNGESLVRQFLYGKKFFQEEFGIETKICWLPDVFGYTGALPQIMKKSEVDYFMTSKISWNDTNDFPYAVFYWAGIDGTKILTHIPRVILPFTYNGEVYADKVLKVKENYEKQKELNVFEYKFGDSSNYFKKDQVIPDDQLMYIYGYGDGGGGVTEEFIEKIKRFDQLPHLPYMKFSQPQEYFIDLERDMIENGINYPVWRGELYLEYHRGTYTTQAQVKLDNRLSETGIRHAEILRTLTGVHSQDAIQKIWEDIGLNQFHDIIPGSSIQEVYEDVDQIYQEIHQRTMVIIQDSLAKLAEGVKLPHGDEEAKYYLVWNGLGYQRDGFVTLDYQPTGEKKKTQFFNLETGQELAFAQRQIAGVEKIVVALENIPAIGYQVIKEIVTDDLSDQLPPVEIPTSKSLMVENPFFRITFTEGEISSLYDKQRARELIAKGTIGNELQFFVDKPPRYEAWEQVAEFRELRIDGQVQVVDLKLHDYGFKKVVTVTKKFRSSTFTQEIILYQTIDRIDFQTEVDWQEREVLVKAAFPVDVCSEQARFEIAYGNLTRPTTNNTSWEKAQFEVPGQRWVDLSEPGLGVSLINDCKYGYDVKDNLIRLTLLKAPNYPDPKADAGLHHFTYSLYAHDGVFYQSDLLRYAEDLTNPLLIQKFTPLKGNTPTEKSYLRIEEGYSRLEVLKESEDGTGWIVRLYEPYGGKDRVKIGFAPEVKIKSAEVVNLLENPLNEDLQFDESSISFPMEPFEIKTVKLMIN